MRTQMTSAVLAVAAGCSTALADLPSYTLITQYKSGQFVTGMGPINSPFFFSSGGAVGGASFRGLAINNSGAAFVHCGVYAQPMFNEAILSTSQGTAPYIGAGFWGTDAGAVGVPTSDHAFKSGMGLALNNNGTLSLQMLLGQGDFGPPVETTTGVSFGRETLVAQQGSVVNAPGLAPGTTFEAFTSPGVLDVNDSNVFLIGAKLLEAGVTRRALLKITSDGAGIVQSVAVVAKEGGPAAGGGVWTDVSIAPNSAAINNAGQVVFSARSSLGVEGVFRDASLIAATGGVSPIPGQPWGSLLGTPADINSGGNVVLRGFYGSGQWTEAADAGESFATASATINGTLNNITGVLSSGTDVDVYRIRISDPAAFSASTVPSPGFPGSAGNTVLYLFRNFNNANGITRIALGRNDDTGSGLQSTVTGANLPPDGNGAGEYYLAISTPQSRPVDAGGNEFWVEDPAFLAVSNGKVYWTDTSDGTIRRADAATGALDPAPYAAAPVPRPYAGQTAGTGKMLNAPFVVSDAPSPQTMLWSTDAYAEYLFHTADPASFSDTAVALTPANAASDVTGMAVDNVNGKVYWTRADAYPSSTDGFLNRCNLDGSGVEILIGTGRTERPRQLAVDPAGGKVYWTDSQAQGVYRSELDGTSVTQIAAGVAAGGIAFDPGAGKVYWSVPTAGTVERAGGDGSARETFKSGLTVTTRKYFPASLAISGGQLYYADVRSRAILKMPIANVNPAATTLVSFGASTSDSASDSPARLEQLGGWVHEAGAAGDAVPYQIRLTGAVAYNQQAMVAMNNTRKVAAVGDSPAAIAPATFVSVGDAGGPLRISDNGRVAYRARWAGGSGTLTGLFLDSDKVFDGLTVPSGNTLMGDLDGGVAGFDMSDSGQYLMVHTGRSLPNFTAQYIAVKVSFASAPQGACPADLGRQGGVPGQDGVLDNNDFVVFIDYFFNQSPPADVGMQGGMPGQDGAFDNNDFVVFIDMFFSGC